MSEYQAPISGLLGDPSRDQYLTAFGKATLTDRYLFTGETYQDLFVRVARAYSDDEVHAARIYNYMSKGWFMPATPILSNGGTDRGLPISCFLNAVSDSLDGIVGTWTENAWLAARGGGIGTYWGGVREIGADINGVGETSGIVPFIKVQDSMTLAISQGSLRRGSAAVYIDIHHPEIEEFLLIRKVGGGDMNRRCLNIHQGVILTDEFMNAVEKGLPFNLISPRTGETVRTVQARELFNTIMEQRVENGEPYMLFIDTVNNNRPEVYQKLNLKVRQSNLCSEIMLHTGIDYLGNDRTAVCCLSSVNAETFDEWKDDEVFILDIYRFLDNVLQDFIDRTANIPGFERARYSATQERSVGLGVMGFHSFLQKNMIAYEGVTAKAWNKKIFKYLKVRADEASRILAEEKGPCPDAVAAGLMERFAHKLATAPTSSISIICRGASPGVEPWIANIFNQKTLSGTFEVRNQYLELVLEKYGKNDHDTWLSILGNKGSVQHLDFLDENELAVFKTAIELDQRWVVDHAADRAPHIDQGQSVNLFCAPDVSKGELIAWHFRAWKAGVKSLYYMRSMAKSRSENISAPTQLPNSDECLSCQ